MEEEESSESGSVSQGQVTGSARSSFSVSDHVGATQDDKKGKKKIKKEKEDKGKDKDKDKGGLFKGLGHMFRYLFFLFLIGFFHCKAFHIYLIIQNLGLRGLLVRNSILIS